MATVERSVLRIDRSEVQQGMTPQHRVRPLMPAAMRGDFAATDPFLALMEDWFPRGVFGKHPHRGIETVTYVVAGRIDHYDNQGHEGTIGPVDVQWMTAGRGLIHNEIPAEGVTVHSLQLWVNLPATDKMTAPRYQDLAGDAVPVRRQPGVEVRVFSGASGGVTAPTKNFVPVTMVEIRLDRGASRSRRSRQRGLDASFSRALGRTGGVLAIHSRSCRPRGRGVNVRHCLVGCRSDLRRDRGRPVEGLASDRAVRESYPGDRARIDQGHENRPGE